MSPKNLPNRPESPPKGLEKAGKLLWNVMMALYEFDAAERGLLVELCRCRDNLERIAAAQLGKPLNKLVLQEQRQQQIVYSRLHAALRLPDVEDGLRRPQRRTGARGAYKPNLRVVS